MVKVIYNDQIVYKVVICAFVGISLWTMKVGLSRPVRNIVFLCFKFKGLKLLLKLTIAEVETWYLVFDVWIYFICICIQVKHSYDKL